MKAGAAIRDITPSEPVVLVTERTSAGVHDPLYAKVLVLDDGSEVAAIVAVDLSHNEFCVFRPRARGRTGEVRYRTPSDQLDSHPFGALC